MITFGSIMTTFVLSSNFGGSWDSSLKPNHHRKFSLPKSVKRSVELTLKIDNFFGLSSKSLKQKNAKQITSQDQGPIL